jgi:hypothetical protein
MHKGRVIRYFVVELDCKTRVLLSILVPQVLNRVEVRRIGREVDETHAVVMEPALGNLSLVLRGLLYSLPVLLNSNFQPFQSVADKSTGLVPYPRALC